MLKKITRVLGLIALLTSVTTQALPIVQADAFLIGDNKAALETNTGLIWMDFGVNSHLSYNQVRDLLPTEYTGWRLPNVAEVDHLWTSLFADLPEWNRFGTGFGTLTSFSHTDYFDSIFSVFGQNLDATYFTVDEEGNPLESWTVKSLFGVFMDEAGTSGYVSMGRPYDLTYPNTTIYLEFNTDVSGWFSTLLVKDSSSTVSEPSPLILALLAIAALLLRARRTA